MPFVRWFALLSLPFFLVSPGGMAQAAILHGPVLNPANGHLYYLLSQNTWTASEQEAVALGGHLATVDDLAEQQWIVRTFVSGFGAGHLVWIGLNDLAQEGLFQWTSGDPLTTGHWSPGEPNNANGNEHFVALFYRGHDAQGLWNDWPDVSSDPIGIPFRGLVEVLPRHFHPGDQTRLTFEGLRGLENNLTPAPEFARLSNQYLGAFGVSFSSAQPWVVVAGTVSVGPTTAPNSITGANSEGAFDSTVPIHIRFSAPAYPEIPATTDYVSIRTDVFATGQTATMEAFDLQGRLLATNSTPAASGATLFISQPGIHRVVIHGGAGTFFDELVFNQVTPARVILDFEDLTGANFLAGSPVPVEARLTDQYLSQGVTFASTGGFAAAVALGPDHAASGSIGFSGSNQEGLVTYEAAHPVEIRFVSTNNPALPGATDYFSVRADLLHNNGADSYLVEAFDVAGTFLGSTSIPDDQGAAAVLTLPEMHLIRIHGSGTTAFDDVIFNPIRSARPPLTATITGSTIDLAWPHIPPGYSLEETSSLTPPLAWETVPAASTASGFEATVPLNGQRFFRLVPAQE